MYEYTSLHCTSIRTCVRCDRLELESRLASLERRRQEEEEQHAAARSRFENELHAVQEARGTADAQLLQLQSRLAQQAQLEERAREEIKQGADAKRKLADTEIELTSLLHEQNQLLEANTALCTPHVPRAPGPPLCFGRARASVCLAFY